MSTKLFLLLLLFAGYVSPLKSQSVRANPLFVFNNGVADAEYNTPAKQVALAKSMGFSGMEKEGIDGLTETLKEIDEQHFKLFTIYININLDNPDQPVDERLEDVFKQLQGRGTMPWFYLTSRKFKPSDAQADTIAVNILRNIADLAAKYGLKVMLYPHKDYWIERVDDAIRVAEQVKRKNLGLSFNLCHFLAVEGKQAEARFIPTVEKAMPHVFAISFNGADIPNDANLQSGNIWDHFIKPLDEGNFNNYKYIQAFTSRGFKGPIGLQCYNVKEKKSEHLKRSVLVWEKYVQQLFKK